MYKRNRWADIADDDCVSRPGGIIDMNALTDLEPLQPPALPPSGFAEIQRYGGIIQKATGTYDVSRGAMAGAQETATTTIALQNVAEIRFKTMAILAERQFIRPLGNLMIRYNRIYMTRPRQVRILGNDFMLDPSSAMPGLPGNMGAPGMMNPGLPPQGTPPMPPAGAPSSPMPAMFGGGMNFMQIAKEDLAEDPDIYAVGAALEVGVNKDMQINNLMKFLQITANPIFLQNPLYSINFGAILERLPYLMNIKLKAPLVTQGNPMLAYQEIQKEQQLADGMMMNEIQGGMPPGAAMTGGGPPSPPSRVKGELSKSTVNQGGEGE
ncbi:MAG TPA: hypothetical protein VI078_01485, partial [bacterium]